MNFPCNSHLQLQSKSKYYFKSLECKSTSGSFYTIPLFHSRENGMSSNCRNMFYHCLQLFGFYPLHHLLGFNNTMVWFNITSTYPCQTSVDRSTCELNQMNTDITYNFFVKWNLKFKEFSFKLKRIFTVGALRIICNIIVIMNLDNTHPIPKLGKSNC